jgi:hypothetical protein
MLMPQGMSKRTSNSTRFVQHANLILWKTDFIFIINNEYSILELMRCSGEAGIGNHLVGSSLSTVKESEVLDDLLQQHFFSLTPTNAVVRHALRPLRLNQSKLRCYIQHIPSSSCSPLFHEVGIIISDLLSYSSMINSCHFKVPLSFSIADALRGKAVIEYPTFHIGLFEDMQRLSLKISTIDTVQEAVDIDEAASSTTALDEHSFSDDSSQPLDATDALDESSMDLHQLISEIGKRSLEDLMIDESSQAVAKKIHS